jgi:Phosphotransferase enzyme family
MDNRREIVITILHRHFQAPDWIITHPKDGRQKACFIARRAEQQVFIKLDAPVAALLRLGEIGAAPRVLVSGVAGDTPYVVQEYIAGNYPDWRWFAHHLPMLARFMQRYHNDQPLTALLSAGARTDYAAHIACDLATLERQYRSLYAAELHTVEIELAFERLEGWSKQLQPVTLVPVHPDPNTKNMLLSGDALVMVDWDDITLSDPMRDAGLLLWWYVAPRQWSEFFQAYGVAMDEVLIERIFWWTARTSFAVALWHVEHGHDCRAFLQDFLAALQKQSNPHAAYGS